MSITIAVVAQGMMGSGVGKRLHERGAEVRTLLSGRSAASAERARAAGMKPAADEKALLDGADFILSILPPGEAENLARQLAPALSALARSALAALRPDNSVRTSAPRSLRRLPTPEPIMPCATTAIVMLMSRTSFPEDASFA